MKHNSFHTESLRAIVNLVHTNAVNLNEIEAYFYYQLAVCLSSGFFVSMTSSIYRNVCAKRNHFSLFQKP